MIFAGRVFFANEITLVRIGIGRFVIAVIGIRKLLIGRLVGLHAVCQIGVIVFEAYEIVATLGDLALAAARFAHTAQIERDEILRTECL